MSVIDEEDYHGVGETLESTEEYDDYLSAYQKLEEIENAEEVLSDTSEMNKEIVADLEGRYPGIVVDNLRYNERYTPTGHQACVESLKRKKDVAVSELATSFLGMLDNLNKMTARLKNTHVSGGISETLDSITKQVKSVEMGSDKLSDEKLILAYTALMGVEPNNANQARELIKKLDTYKNPILCLKDFPNSNYDKMFTELLSNTVGDNMKVFRAFEDMDTHYSDAIVNNIHVVQSQLTNIIREDAHDKLSRFTGDIIPKDVDIVLNDIVAGLDISIDASKPLLRQIRKIGAEVSKKLRTTEESIEKKGMVLNSVTHQFKHIDEGFVALSSATNKLAALSDKDVSMISDIEKGLKGMRQKRTKGIIVNQVITPVGRQTSKQYKRIMGDIQNLWQLVNLFVRLSVAYVSCYSILKITLDKFSLRLLVFLKTVGDMKRKGQN